MVALREDARWLTTVPIAHRGLHDIARGIPENSLAAFKGACSMGYPVELDVRLTSDGHVVVFHDQELDRLTGTTGTVSRMNYKEISRLRLGLSNEQIPTLADVLDLVRGDVPVMIEIKNTGRVGELEDKVARITRKYRHELAVISFNPLSIRHMKKATPTILRGQVSGLYRDEHLAGSPLSGPMRFALRNMIFNGLSSPDFIVYQLEGISSVTVAIRSWIGVPILAWTVRSSEQESIARRYADGILFEGFTPVGFRRSQ